MIVKQVSVDLDRADTVMLLRAYFSAHRVLCLVLSIDAELAIQIPIEVTVSPTGVGYHIKIRKEVTVEQDLKIRALLWDHADRLAYALRKWALNPSEQYVDLVFDEKNDGKERVLPLESILMQHPRKVQKIRKMLDRGENEEADKEVKKLAKNIGPEIGKYKRKQYVGCIAFKGDDLREPLEKVCSDIAQKDDTFTWKLYPCWFPEFDWILAVFADDKDKAWKRITWLKNRAMKDDKLILKDAETRLFVKERTST